MRHFSFVILFRVIPLISLAHIALAQQPIAAEPGMDVLGAAYDSATGNVMPPCLTITATTPGPAIANNVQYTQLIVDKSDLSKELRLSASASYSAGFGSAAASASVLQNSTVNQFSVTFIARVSIDKPWANVVEVSLKPSVVALVNAHDLFGFRQKCGDRWVAGIQSGGDLIGLLTMQTRSTSEQDTLMGKVRAESGVFEANASFSEDFQAALKAYDATGEVWATGGAPVASNTLDRAEFMKRAQGFAQEVASTGGVAKSIRLLPYTALVDWPTSIIPVDSANVLMDLANERWAFVSFLDAIRYAKKRENWKQFIQKPDTASKLTNLETTVSAAITTIDQVFRSCQGEATSPCQKPVLPKLEDLQTEMPVRYEGSCDERAIVPPPIADSFLKLPNTGGDTEMMGNNPRVVIQARPIVSSDLTLIRMYVKVQIQEAKKDWSTFMFEKFEDLLVLDRDAKGCLFPEGYPGSADLKMGVLSYQFGRNDHEWRILSGGSPPTNTAECLGDTKGDDRNQLGCKNITFRPVIVRLIHKESSALPTSKLNTLKRLEITKMAAVKKQVQEHQDRVFKNQRWPVLRPLSKQP